MPPLHVPLSHHEDGFTQAGVIVEALRTVGIEAIGMNDVTVVLNGAWWILYDGTSWKVVIPDLEPPVPPLRAAEASALDVAFAVVKALTTRR